MSFSPPQLQEIRKTSLARVLCDASDSVTVMQPLAFLPAKLTSVISDYQTNLFVMFY